MIWRNCVVPFFSKGGSGVCSLVATRPLSFSAGPAQIFPLKPASFCYLSTGLESTNKSANFHLLPPNRRSVLATLSFSLSFCLSQSPALVAKLSFLSFFTIRIQCVPGHLFLAGNDVAHDLARRETKLLLSASPVVALLVTLVSTLVISRTEGHFFNTQAISSKFFNTQVPLVSNEEHVLSCHARWVLLSSLERTKLSVKLFTRIGRIENAFCSASGHSSQDTSHLILHCPATDSLRHSLFGDSLSLHDLWLMLWGVCRFLWPYGLWPYTHPSEGVE